MENRQLTLTLEPTFVDNKVLKGLEKDLETLQKLRKRKIFSNLNSSHIINYSLLTPATLQAIAQKYNLEIKQNCYSVAWSATMYVNNFRIECLVNN